MGTLTLADFREEVRLICGGLPTGSTVWTNDAIDRRINASYLWCSMPNHYRHPELEEITYITLLADTARYALTSDYYMITGVSHAHAATLPIGTLTDSTRRTKLDPLNIRDLLTIDRQEGRPSHYAFWDNIIVLSNTPDTTSAGQTLEVYGYEQPATLSAPAAVTVLKPEWDEIIVIGAEWRMWISMGEPDRAYEAKQNLGALVNEVADVRRLHAEEWGWQTSGGPQQMMRTD